MHIFFVAGIIPCVLSGDPVWPMAPAMTHPDDAILLQAVARRDEAAFAELYDRLSRPGFSLVVRVLRSRVALESLAGDDRGDAVRAALNRLTSEEGRAIALAFFDGLTHDEIAAALRAPVGTIKARIRRGLLKLKPALARVRQAEAL